ncbi:hypothetical protein CSC2_26760 [Clostridium zeae]|uniref:Uncharacterized protein n=1 Tax=Clostridium zeae TaxID=2759022 RepID=A0ABQ1EBH6_9CLOT|nr:hypothetical protein CSC2_26760 [Clostridium zeae]
MFLDHERAITEEDLTDEELEEKSLVEWLEDNFYYVSSSFDELINSVHPLE